MKPFTCVTACLLALALLATPTVAKSKLRTVVTTDLEQDDLASLIRYLLYTNDLDTQGLIYSSSRFHWSGDGNGTKFFIPDREYTSPQWTYRWTGTRTIQDKVLKQYAEVYPNLINHDPFYPSPEHLQSLVKIGNIDFEGEMDHDTEGSDFIKSLLLDNEPRTLYLQAWGGTNTIARALKSLEEQHSSSSNWEQTKKKVSAKTVIMASGFQDKTYAQYISKQWPQIRVENFEPGYETWAYNCNSTGQGSDLGAAENAHKYFAGAWIKQNIQTGPYGSLYRSWLDGQKMAGDPLDVFGNLSWYKSSAQTCQPLQPYDFLSEGDNVAFNPLLTTGLQDPSNPKLGGWGGRSYKNSTSPELWEMVDSEKSQNGTEIAGYTVNRWLAAIQNDFAARMQWTLTPNYTQANHAPVVQILNGTRVDAHAGSSVILAGNVTDPDHDRVTTSWWQFFEEGSYPGSVKVKELSQHRANVTVPADAKQGQNISMILQATDHGQFPLTRYGRVWVQVV